MKQVSYWKYGCALAKLGYTLAHAAATLRTELRRELNFFEYQGFRNGYRYGEKTYKHFDPMGM